MHNIAAIISLCGTVIFDGPGNESGAAWNRQSEQHR